MSRTRLVRVVTALITVIALVGTSTGCGLLRPRSGCPTETATFPLVGQVVKKEKWSTDCYVLYVVPAGFEFERIVQVNFFRYKNAVIGGNIWYPTSQSAKE